MRELMFQDNSLRIIESDGQRWVGAADIARALGYAEPGKVTRLYDRHKAEFTESMTRLVMLPDLDAQSGHPGQKRLHRVFTLRGAHLVAMFARTAKGQEFRRWLLDLIDSQHDRQKSLVQLYYEAKADELAQQRFASLCGRGLNEHKRVMPPKRERVEEILNQLQPSLQLT